MQLQGQLVRIDPADEIRSNIVLLNPNGIEDIIQTRNPDVLTVANTLIGKNVVATIEQGSQPQITEIKN